MGQISDFWKDKNVVAKIETIGDNGRTWYYFIEDAFTRTYWIRVSKHDYLKSNLPIMQYAKNWKGPF